MARKGSEDKPRRLLRSTRTRSIRAAFVAAMLIEQEWDSPKGPAVVKDVVCLVGGQYGIEYRLVAEWGKEAWG
jgi:hypothetical protein